MVSLKLGVIVVTYFVNLSPFGGFLKLNSPDFCLQRLSFTYSKFLFVAHTEFLLVTNVSFTPDFCLVIDETYFIFDGAIVFTLSLKLWVTAPFCSSEES
jgi:hypothetical protein